MKSSHMELLIIILILFVAIFVFTQMSKRKNEGLDLPKCDGISGAPGSYCNPLPPCPTGTTVTSDGKNCIDNITKQIRNPDPNSPLPCPEQGMTKSKDEKGQDICTYTDPNDPRKVPTAEAAFNTMCFEQGKTLATDDKGKVTCIDPNKPPPVEGGATDPTMSVPAESAPMEFSLMQFGLMAVVGIGLFVVILVSARNYSPAEWIILGFFFVVVVTLGWKYFFDSDVSATVKNLFSKKPELNVKVVTDEPKKKEPKAPKAPSAPKKNKNDGKDANKQGDPQVFHVPGQYKYTDARALCRAYGGTLANIEQVNDAHKKGAEWCNYGWSEDQMALYPTQTKTWEKFNKSELNKKDCGRPGVNGGYTMDLNSLLGANCFGPKPAQPENTEIQPPPFPTDPVDQEAEKFKGNLPNVSAFNYEKWDE
jgi:hypothetical protein